MSIKKVEIQDSTGTIYYPHTEASVVKNGSQTVADQLKTITQPNILYNGGFVINQRNKNQYTKNYDYTVDRWMLCNMNKDGQTMVGVLNVGDGYVELTGMGDSQLYIQQPLLEECSWLSGKTITFAVDARVENMTKGEVFVQIGYRQQSQSGNTDNHVTTFVNNSQINSIWKRYSVSVTLPDNIHDLWLLCGSFNDVNTGYDPVNSDCKMYFKDAKLEVGTEPTPFVSRSYGEELTLCQRYHQIIRSDTAYPLAFRFNDNLDFLIPLAVPMRINPTISIPDGKTISILNFDDGSSFKDTQLFGSAVDTKGYGSSINLRVSKPNNGVKNGACWASGFDISLDAEIR